MIRLETCYKLLLCLIAFVLKKNFKLAIMTIKKFIPSCFEFNLNEKYTAISFCEFIKQII